MMKTYSPKPTEVTHEWYLIDADGQTLGRLASKIAGYLLGKSKVNSAPHIDAADNVVVINASKVAVTGSKLTDKMYYRHSGYPGGLTEINLAAQIERNPAVVIEHAVRGMVPKNRLADDRMSHLKIYPGPEHPHAGQNPKVLGDK